MSQRGLRLKLAGVSFIAVALLLGLGLVFWRTLPPMGPMPVHARSTRPFAGVLDLPSVLPEPSLEGIRVTLIEEPENERVTPPNYYETDLKRWREWLRSAGAVTSSAEHADVLVVPEARCLGPVQRRVLAAHLARGRGILTTGALGARDGDCKPLRDTLLAQLVGAARGDIAPAPRNIPDSFYALILGETILGADLPPGARMDLTPVDQIVFRHPGREVFYSDFRRRPLSAPGGADAAVVRALVDRGRVVAFGFSIQNYDDEWSRKVGSVLMSNAIRWAAGRPSFQIAPWPVGKRAAAVLAHDVEADFDNARDVVAALKPYKLPGTAFIVGDLAEADGITTAQLVQSAEIGTHTHRHLLLDTLAPDELLRELENSKRAAERIVGKPVPGMRPPEERYTLASLQHWADLGGDYVFTWNDLRTAAPEIIPLLPDSLILLGRVSDDDFELLSRDRMRDRRQMSGVLVQQIDEIVANRGLYMFSYHSHLLGQKQLLPVLRALAEKLEHSPEVWTTTAGDVARWWRARAALRLDRSDPKTVRIANAADRAFTGGMLLIDLPTGRRNQVALPALQAGQTITVDVEGRVLNTASSVER